MELPRELKTDDDYFMAKRIYNAGKHLSIEHSFERNQIHLMLKNKNSIRELIDYDAAEFPDGLWLSMYGDNFFMGLKNLEFKIWIIRNGTDLILTYTAEFDSEQSEKMNLNPIKILVEANANAHHFGLKHGELSTCDQTCFYNHYNFELKNPKGNLFSHYEEGLKRVWNLFEQTYAIVKTSSKAD